MAGNRTNDSRQSSRSGSVRNTDWTSTANRTLHEAMANERSKRWSKVVSNYRTLLDILYEQIPPEDRDRPAWITLLLYECHYHLGVALQQLNQQKQAISEFTRAIRSVFIPRNGCMVTRCRLASCLMTPIYARRAFAYAFSGDLKNATLDADKAVVFDSTNPDVYCIRALVLNTNNKTSQAAEDIHKALQFNRNHLCALILQGGFKKKFYGNKPNDFDDGRAAQTTPEEHLRAAKLNPESYHYLTVDNFRHDQIVEFYDKFLYSLNVPHTISSMMMPEENDVSQALIHTPKQNDRVQILSRSNSSPSFSGSFSSRKPSDSRISSAGLTGVAKSTDGTVYKTSKTKELSDVHLKRKAYYNDQVTPKSFLERRKAYGQAVTNGNAKSIKQPTFISLERPRTAVGNKTMFQRRSFDEICFEPKQQTVRTFNGIQIFQEVNLCDTPRLYCRPWVGDRLPVSETQKKQQIFPPFKV